jgi:hypothetical protein
MDDVSPDESEAGSEQPDAFFAPPAFKAADALIQLKRQLRDLKPLAERGAGFELNGRPVIVLSGSERQIETKLARRAIASPDWDRGTIDSSAAMRKFVDTVKARLVRWVDDD